MTNYKDIHGFQIETVTSNPDNPVNGQVWYNSTDQKLRGFTSNSTGSWATGGAMNTTSFGRAGLGIQTAALAAGGQTSTAIVGNVESYNGTAFSEVADITARRLPGGAGTTTAGLVFGGSSDSTTGSGLAETWNGSAFSEVNDLNSARGGLGDNGTQTSALGYGGRPGSVAVTESWNGTSWTEVNDLNQARHVLAGAGADNTSALAIGGMQTADYQDETGKTESWNGSAWTEVNDLNTARGFTGAGGIVTAAIVFGGRKENPGSGHVRYGQTEIWNGTSWAEVADLNISRSNLGGNGTTALALGYGGFSPPSDTLINGTEEWSEPVNTTVEFDLS
tara:strand:+ start:738 stop:1742 length:1005 start_codon:yes stop_codon:yes gene_type:complete